MRLQKIHIQNYKGIKELHLSFPEPLMSDDPDVTVLGSKNGVGKTSVLECVALLTKVRAVEVLPDRVSSSLIHDSAASFCAEGVFTEADGGYAVEAELHRDGVLSTLNGGLALPNNPYRCTVSEVQGLTPEPIVGRDLLFIHGYRKIREGRLGMGNIVSGDAASLSTFKAILVRLLMAKAGLLDASQAEGAPSLELLEDLLLRYAGVRLGKLRPMPDNTFEIQVVKEDSTGVIFPIDGLSSGQKEIISMLFMIYEQTRNNPRIVLIDEPELHLNMQWHKLFMQDLFRLAPHNQYIIATHSEQIMDAVAPGNRMMLS